MKTKKESSMGWDVFKQSLLKFDVRIMIKNPVMFIVEMGFFLTVLLTFFPNMFGVSEDSSSLLNGIIAVILFCTILFANYAESLAEGRGKAQASALRQTKKDMMAHLIQNDGQVVIVSAQTLKRGDRVRVSAGEVIPNDGEVIEGVATVDESAITGESAPVVKEPGGDFCSVTGGTTVTSDVLIIRIEADPGTSFMDKMISMVEGASRKKTPNEIALSTLLVSLTIIFLIAVLTLEPIAKGLGAPIPISILIALLVCLIPTTIGGLLSAIGIAGMDRVTKFNVIAMSGKAVEACGDVDVMMLDKTGTITYGNRLAHTFYPVENVPLDTLIMNAVKCSLWDTTPEGKSIVDLAHKHNIFIDETAINKYEFSEFTAQTRMSGIRFNNHEIQKGAADAVKNHVKLQGGMIPKDLDHWVEIVSKEGGTPLVVCEDLRILGVIYLKDTIKEGLIERFERLRSMGIKTIMCTGDNPLTAATIAQEAGVDGFLAECRPEDKIDEIKKEQALGKIVAMTGDGINDAPALAQADVGIAMNSGTIAAKEAANMVDLDSDPTKILDIVEIGKQLLMTRGALTTFSISNDVAKYFAVLPALFITVIPEMEALNIMKLNTPSSAILSALIFNAIIIPLLIPIAMKGVKYRPESSNKILRRNLLMYGLGGIITPFILIKAIDLMIYPLLSGLGL